MLKRMIEKMLKSLALKKSLSPSRSLELGYLESRINPSQVVDVTFVNGALILKSNTQALETNNFSISQILPDSHVLQLKGANGTIFQGAVNIFSSGFNSPTAEINSLDLNGFNKIQILGGDGNEVITFGNLDGNIIGDISQANFAFNVDTYSSNAGSSGGNDSLNINGNIGLKGAGDFATDITSSGQIYSGVDMNLDNITLGSSAAINSVGTGRIRLVADGLPASTIVFGQSAGLSNGSGDIFIQAGSVGSIQLNSNTIENVGSLDSFGKVIVGNIDLKSQVVINGSSTISNLIFSDNSANITFYKDVTGVSISGQDLNVQSRGVISFQGSLGTASIPLGAISIGSSSNLINPSQLLIKNNNSNINTNVFAKSFSAFTKDQILINGTITTNYIDGVFLQANDSSSFISIGKSNSLNPAIDTTNLGKITINNIGTLQINADILSKGNITQNGTGPVIIGTPATPLDLSISAETKTIYFNSPITLNQNLNVTSNSTGLSNGGDNITFNSTIDGLFQIQANSGIGTITFNGPVGSINEVAAITIMKASSFVAQGITAYSLLINDINGTTVFNGIQNYSKAGGLIVNSYTSNGSIYINNAINLANDAQLSINNTGVLSINNLGVITSNTGAITLGGSGAGKLLFNANINSTSGNINVLNAVDFYSDISISNNSGTVTFADVIQSMKSIGSANLTLVSSINDANFVFQSAVGSVNPMGNININSGKNVTWNSDVQASNVTVSDLAGSVAFNGNLTLSGSLVTNSMNSRAYAFSMLGSNNRIQLTTTLGHLGLTTLGNSNTDSFLFSGGLEETGAGGVVAMGAFVSGGSMNFISEFIVGGNNIGQVTFDASQDSVMYSRLVVQPNERLIKNGLGGLRLINNNGGTFQGTLVANNGTLTILDDFSSIISTVASGGTLSGTGTFGNVSALAGKIAPGDNVGNLSARNVNANNLSSMVFDVGATQTSSDSLTLNGTLTLSSPTLTITPGNFLRIGQPYLIINNDSTDAIIGNFSGLPEGSSFSVSNYTFQITYKGGDGNDVALTLKSNSNPIPPSPIADNPIVMATAADAGGGPMVTVRYADGHEYSFFAYNPSFTGGVRISMGDINGDGYTDLVTGVGIGGGPHIKVWNLTSGIAQVVASFFAFESAFTGGLYLGVGNLNGDVSSSGFGIDDIIVGAGPGGGPRVTAFAGAQAFAINQNQVLTNFFAYSDTFRGGVTVAAADRNGDGRDDIVTGAGYGGGPNVTVFQLIQTTPNQFNPQIIQNFFVFDTTFTGGIFVAGGRFTSQTLDDIFVGTGPGTQAKVAVAFGTGGFYYLAPFGNFQGGARVGIASTSPTAGGTNYLVAAAGPGGGPQVNVYNNSFGVVDSFFAINPAMTLGVFANTNIL